MSIIYILAVVAANLSVVYFGPASTIINAFLFIGFDMTARDKLHEQWKGRGLWWKMLLLVLIGSAISYAMNRNAGIIAIASMIAFGVSELADALVYHRLRNKGWFAKVNGSNVVSAALDSAVFPTIAFGMLLPQVVIGQFIAKLVGGFVWSLVLKSRKSQD